ncbi:MAG TPA: CopD family protein [Steroidobacteraceae bacterium]|jgi:putative copper resistance protein D|nr:CopD family protein [Steroidobacteraceae bacterium]
MEISGWDIADVFAKAATYAATLAAAGAIFFLAYCSALLRDSQRIVIRRFVGILIGAAALLSVCRILLLSGSVSGEFAGMVDSRFARMILGAGEGRASGARIIGLMLALLALSPNPKLRGPAVLGGIIAATSFAWVGHVHALTPNVTPILLLCLHLLCAAFWLGALPPLWVIAAGGNEVQIAAAAARFGKLALRVVALLLAAGLSLLFMLIGGVAQLWSSDYGRLMSIKLLAVAVLLGLAAWNKLSLTPKMLGHQARATVLFRRSLAAEIGVGAFILTITAAFTTLTGPR